MASKPSGVVAPNAISSKRDRALQQKRVRGLVSADIPYAEHLDRAEVAPERVIRPALR